MSTKRSGSNGLPFVVAGVAALVGWNSMSQETRDWIKRFGSSILDQAATPPPQALQPPPARPALPLRQSEAIINALKTRQRPTPQISSDIELMQKLPESGVITIPGKRDSGKTVTGFRVLDHMGRSRSKFVVGMPESASSFLPETIGMVDTVEELPNNCVALIDEAYQQFHAMEKVGRVKLSRFLNLCRQRNQLLIFIAQDLRQLVRYIIQATDAFLVKKLSPLQVESDRQRCESSL